MDQAETIEKLLSEVKRKYPHSLQIKPFFREILGEEYIHKFGETYPIIGALMSEDFIQYSDPQKAYIVYSQGQQHLYICTIYKKPL